MKADVQFQRGHYLASRGVSAVERGCPICNGPVDRIRRRLVDRLLSLFRPTYRYRCRSKGWGCEWEGNLR